MGGDGGSFDSNGADGGWSKRKTAKSAGGAVGKGILQGAGRKIGATIVGALLVGGGIFGVSQASDDDDSDDQPTTSQQSGDDE